MAKWTVRLSSRVYFPFSILLKTKCIFEFDGIGMNAKIYHFCNQVVFFIWEEKFILYVVFRRHRSRCRRQVGGE